MSDGWMAIIVTAITVTGSIITAIITAIIMKRQPKPTSKRFISFVERIKKSCHNIMRFFRNRRKGQMRNEYVELATVTYDALIIIQRYLHVTINQYRVKKTENRVLYSEQELFKYHAEYDEELKKLTKKLEGKLDNIKQGN